MSIGNFCEIVLASLDTCRLFYTHFTAHSCALRRVVRSVDVQWHLAAERGRPVERTFPRSRSLWPETEASELSGLARGIRRRGGGGGGVSGNHVQGCRI